MEPTAKKKKPNSSLESRKRQRPSEDNEGNTNNTNKRQALHQPSHQPYQQPSQQSSQQPAYAIAVKSKPNEEDISYQGRTSQQLYQQPSQQSAYAIVEHKKENMNEEFRKLEQILKTNNLYEDAKDYKNFIGQAEKSVDNAKVNALPFIYIPYLRCIQEALNTQELEIGHIKKISKCWDDHVALKFTAIDNTSRSFRDMQTAHNSLVQYLSHYLLVKNSAANDTDAGETMKSLLGEAAAGQARKMVGFVMNPRANSSGDEAGTLVLQDANNNIDPVGNEAGTLVPQEANNKSDPTETGSLFVFKCMLTIMVLVVVVLIMGYLCDHQKHRNDLVMYEGMAVLLESMHPKPLREGYYDNVKFSNSFSLESNGGVTVKTTRDLSSAINDTIEGNTSKWEMQTLKEPVPTDAIMRHKNNGEASYYLPVDLCALQNANPHLELASANKNQDAVGDVIFQAHDRWQQLVHREDSPLREYSQQNQTKLIVDDLWLGDLIDETRIGRFNKLVNLLKEKEGRHIIDNGASESDIIDKVCEIAIANQFPNLTTAPDSENKLQKEDRTLKLNTIQTFVKKELKNILNMSDICSEENQQFTGAIRIANSALLDNIKKALNKILDLKGKLSLADALQYPARSEYNKNLIRKTSTEALQNIENILPILQLYQPGPIHRQSFQRQLKLIQRLIEHSKALREYYTEYVQGEVDPERLGARILIDIQSTAEYLNLWRTLGIGKAIHYYSEESEAVDYTRLALETEIKHYKNASRN